MWHALAKVPLQQITPHVDVRITWKRDAANLINIPITINNETADFVFDTGANISTINKSYAGKLGLQLIQTSFDLGSGTSITNKASLAVAPSLKISGIELKNVIFMVLPDDQLSFPQINYSIHGIIGFPVINQLGEVHVAKNGTMFIPAKPQAGKVHNLALDELTPIISLATNRDTLSYTFDTGAKESELFKLYFDKYIAEIKQTGKADTIKRGGAGGVVKYLVYKLPLFHFKVSSKEVNLPGISVLTTLEGAKDEFYYGNIGQDLIGNFDEIIINFKQMYIDFK